MSLAGYRFEISSSPVDFLLPGSIAMLNYGLAPRRPRSTRRSPNTPTCRSAASSTVIVAVGVRLRTALRLDLRIELTSLNRPRLGERRVAVHIQGGLAKLCLRLRQL